MIRQERRRGLLYFQVLVYLLLLGGDLPLRVEGDDASQRSQRRAMDLERGLLDRMVARLVFLLQG